MVVGRRPVLAGQKVDVADPEPDRRGGHPRRVDVLLEHTAQDVNAEQLLAFDKILVTPAALERLAERTSK